MKILSQEDDFIWRKDGVVLLFLCLFVLSFWLPAFLRWVPLLDDDYIYHHFPLKFLYARSLQQGTLPWWDPHTFCGAWPIPHRPDGGLYYLPDYPILLLTPLSNLDTAVKLLVELPMSLHYLLMAVSVYLLGRLGFRLNRIGSVVLSVAFTMSPAVNYLAFSASIVTLHAWLPLIWLLLLLFIRRGGWRYPVLAGCVLALQIAGGGAGHLVRLWTFTAFLFLGVAARHLIVRDRICLFRTVAGAGVMLAIGLSLSAPAWLGFLEGYRSLDLSGVVTIGSVAGGGYSLEPGYLATLLVPNLFGSVIGTRGWGVGHTVLFDQSNLLGGMLLVLLAVGGVAAVRRSSGAPERFWILLAGAGVILGIFIVLGRHTPVYRLLFRVLPIFRVPYAVRWRDFQSFSMVILAGASASLLSRGGVPQKLLGPRMIAWYVAVLLLTVLVIAFLPLPDWRGRYFRFAIIQAVESGVLGGILKKVLPYLAAGFLLLLGMVYYPRRRIPILLVGVLAELILWGWLTFYLQRDWFGTEYGDDPLIIHHGDFSETPLGKIVVLDPGENGSGWYRTMFYRSRLANSSWFTGGLSLFGYDCKPLLPRFDDILRQLGPRGIIYEMVVERWDTRLPANLSVNRAVVEAEQVRPGAEEPTIEDIIVPVVETDGPFARLADRPVAVRVPGALPRFFTQDRIVVCSPEEALNELLYGDLRKAVFVEEGNQLSVIGDRLSVTSDQLDKDGNRISATGNQLLGSPKGRTYHRLLISDYKSFNSGSEQEAIERFKELQSANRILDLDIANPNQVRIAIDIAIPSLLVMTDVWHPDWEVTVDGETARLLRVNYLQRGLWLGKGTHEVMMTFVPGSWKMGRWGTAGGTLLVLLIMIYGSWGKAEK